MIKNGYLKAFKECKKNSPTTAHYFVIIVIREVLRNVHFIKNLMKRVATYIPVHTFVHLSLILDPDQCCT